MPSWSAERHIYLTVQSIVRIHKGQGEATGRKCTSHKAENGYRILVDKTIGKIVPERLRRT